MQTLPTVSMAGWKVASSDSTIHRMLTLAMYSGLPPRRMSVPRPAMLVEMVTEPRRPLCATISASRCTFSGFAFSSSYGMPTHARGALLSRSRHAD